MYCTSVYGKCTRGKVQSSDSQPLAMSTSISVEEDITKTHTCYYSKLQYSSLHNDAEAPKGTRVYRMNELNKGHTVQVLYRYRYIQYELFNS